MLLGLQIEVLVEGATGAEIYSATIIPDGYRTLGRFGDGISVGTGDR